MGVRLSMRNNVEEVFADLDAAVKLARDVAAPRAVNKLRDQAQVAGAREISRIYGIGVRAVQDSRFVTITLANSGKPVASISMGGPGFPLSLFSPLKVPGQGVSVLIKGQRVLIPHAFLAVAKSGHILVAARGAYGGKSNRPIRSTGAFGRFVFGRGQRIKAPNVWGSSELPINEFLGFSLGDAFGNDEVVAAMQARVEEQAPSVLAQEIRFAIRGR